MPGLFTEESISSGSFTKFMSIIVLAITTIGGLAVNIYAALNPQFVVPQIIQLLTSAGVIFFVKAAGIADGAQIAQTVITRTLPVLADAVQQTTTKSVASAAQSAADAVKSTVTDGGPPHA